MVMFVISSLIISIVAYVMSLKLEDKDKAWTNLAIGAILLNLLSITIMLMN